LKPLTNALRELQWLEEMAAKFKTSKRSLQHVVELAHLVTGARLVLAVDASDTHAGAALQ